MRKRYLVNAPIQMSVAFAVFGALVLFSLIYLVAFLVVAYDGSTLADPSSRAAIQLGVVVTGAYFLLVLIGVVIVAVKTTHRIAGPAAVIEEAVEGMVAGDYERRLTLRPRDHLKSLAAAVGKLRAELESDRERRSELHEKIEEALASGQYELVRDLNRECAGELLQARQERKAS
jgi:HAMP domain-containing protein